MSLVTFQNGAIVLFVILSYKYVIYPLMLSPLRHIPGPLKYKLSSIFTLNDQRTEQRNVKLSEMHDKFGPVVQLSPFEVSFNSIDMLKFIYIKKNLPKSTFYKQFTNYSESNAFSTLETKPHLQRKKLMVKLYSKSSVLSKSSQQHLNNKINQVVKFVEKNLSKSFDSYDLFNAMAMDVVTYYEVGPKFTTDLINDEKERSIIKSFRASSSMWFYTTLMPKLWDYAAGKEVAQLACQSSQWAKKIFDDSYKSLVDNYELHETDNESTIKKLFDSGLPQKKIASELFDHVAAGHETTGTSMAYATWELSRPCKQYLQKEIYAEMCQAFGSIPQASIDLEKLDKLPLLSAVITEVTRLHAAIPGSEPRIINEKTEIQLPDNSKVTLPVGTIVSVQPWSVHRDASVFPDPNKFVPERWLKQHDETEEQFNERTKVMKSCIFTFGQGNRMCLGMHVALLEMKLAIAQLYWKFTSRISDEWCKHVEAGDSDVLMGYSTFKGKPKSEMSDIELMSMADSYTSRPIHDECWLVWDRIKSN